jgi:hypothetical protein
VLWVIDGEPTTLVGTEFEPEGTYDTITIFAQAAEGPFTVVRELSPPSGCAHALHVAADAAAILWKVDCDDRRRIVRQSLRDGSCVDVPCTGMSQGDGFVELTACPAGRMFAGIRMSARAAVVIAALPDGGPRAE